MSTITTTGLLLPAFIYALIFALGLLLPASRIEGYVLDPLTRRPTVYHLNGLLVLVVVLGAAIAAFTTGVLDPAILYDYRWAVVAGACLLGLLYTLILVLPAEPTGKGLLTDLFLGRTENLAYFNRIDAKMYLYVTGAVMLVLTVISFASAHHRTWGDATNPGVYLHAVLLTLFVLDYLVFERVHLYTYDIFAERLGFKLAWGCFVFYPFFYPIGLWAAVEMPESGLMKNHGAIWMTGCVLVFLSGWVLARGANMQKYVFKRDPKRVFLGRIAPEVIGNGEQKLLCSGFWGVSRHINYLGEILMAIGIAASLGHLDSPWPWLYPLYYVLLLVPRERDDDRRCAAKYGALWTEYQRTVPWRIVPRIY